MTRGRGPLSGNVGTAMHTVQTVSNTGSARWRSTVKLAAERVSTAARAAATEEVRVDEIVDRVHYRPLEVDIFCTHCAANIDPERNLHRTDQGTVRRCAACVEKDEPPGDVKFCRICAEPHTFSEFLATHSSSSRSEASIRKGWGVWAVHKGCRDVLAEAGRQREIEERAVRAAAMAQWKEVYRAKLRELIADFANAALRKSLGEWFKSEL